ncbi:hypothetical protein [Caproiciproducens faecalis]|uniref:Uncharacterized protein n=1 Tax=Caproiciproducens faecalis TaxID=2820301 RepID=A0ABS7DK38_9FIRM|nr:hypothetical protein [Caproiciproducens faecalis]MBW7571461.1 hypothetical protein [Caproiciproducens faecalis]
MNSGNNGSTGYLDRIRRARGANFCKNTLLRTERGNRQTAVRLINDDRLLFATLFVLQPEIRERGLYRELSGRNRTALNICQKIMSAKYPSDGTGSEISLKSEEVHSAMLWMLNTGAADDGLSSDFDQVLDITASVLVKTHHEKTVLPVMADLIFRRNRRGVYNHDMVWAFFQARDPQSLRLLASRLRSPSRKDVELARLLLNIPENTPLNTNRDKQKQYEDYLAWLDENSPYVYFTGESLQLTNAPCVCGVNQEAKYLCKDISPRYNRPLTPLTEEELANLEQFHEAKGEEQAVLATFSSSLHSQNQSSWSQWMQYPVGRQIDIAKYGRRELV